MWQSSNPALASNDAFNEYYGNTMARPDVATLSGVVNKTSILVMIAVALGAVGYSVTVSNPGALWISSITALVVCLGIFFVMRGKPTLAPVLALIYAAVEGFFLGAFTCLADAILKQKGLAVTGGVGLQAFIITVAAMVSMLAAYRAKIIRPTKTFQAIIVTATGAIFFAYMASFILGFFFNMPLPLISFASAVNSHGAMGLLGLGINLLILVVASLWLILDFKLVEDTVSANSPKYMEWYCGFALLVTLAWIYYEAVKLVVRIAILFGNRD